MTSRGIAAGLLLALPALAFAAGKKASKEPTEAQRLEHFAVAQCLITAFPGTPMAEDAGRALGGYVQLGSADFDTYDAISALAPKYLASPYQSKSGKSLHVMQCLDFPQDPALQALIRRYR
ncbi:T6SS amidase immunity protein Tai4 family protein [Bordetella genomosp. 13]|uniref:T6SS amidase immunity protein Tai4 family protein n=1 Tax=Bordetella genomosp. 13 TaxID=463040 RepID=UPI00164332DD|nr:T6SS amidase immunity protein Tai4 family protein [Bordetella genomosp. 13]